MEDYHYTQADIEKDIARQLALLPEGKSGAVVAHLDIQLNVSLSLVLKIGDSWAIAAEGFHKPKEGFSSKVEVLHSW